MCQHGNNLKPKYGLIKSGSLSGFDNIIVKPLEDDLKYYNTEQVREIFYGQKNETRSS